MSEPTTYLTKCDILAELWIEQRQTPQFQEFFQYNDLGLPLAYAVSVQIVESTPLVENFIEDTFDMLLTVLSIEDIGFDSLSDVLAEAESKQE